MSVAYRVWPQREGEKPWHCLGAYTSRRRLRVANAIPVAGKEINEGTQIRPTRVDVRVPGNAAILHDQYVAGPRAVHRRWEQISDGGVRGACVWLMPDFEWVVEDGVVDVEYDKEVLHLTNAANGGEVVEDDKFGVTNALAVGCGWG